MHLVTNDKDRFPSTITTAESFIGIPVGISIPERAITSSIQQMNALLCLAGIRSIWIPDAILSMVDLQVNLYYRDPSSLKCPS
jgi:hypothetical protein